MATRQYKLYTATPTTSNGAASLRVSKKGFITSVQWVVVGGAGAGTTGYGLFELSKQNTSSYAINDTPETVVDYCCVTGAIASAAIGTNSLHAGMRNPVDVGDTLYLNLLYAGTAFASCLVQCNVTIDQ